MSRLILFTFAGREADMEAQRPVVAATLAAHPDAEFHVWNMTRNASDDAYVRAYSGERTTVINDLWQGPNEVTECTGVRSCQCTNCRLSPWMGPWRHYAGAEYEGARFVKFDDDTIFWDVARFGRLLKAIDRDPTRIWSANVANNPGCAYKDPDLHPVIAAHYEDARPRRWRHLGNEPDFARISHDWLLDNYDHARTAAGYVRADRWAHVPINMIGVHHALLAPFLDADPANWRKDETFLHALAPVWIVRGFRAAHLYYRVQKHGMTDTELDGYRTAYGALHERLMAEGPNP